MPVAKKIAKNIPIVSAYSLSMIEINREKAAATSSTLITGS